MGRSRLVVRHTFIDVIDDTHPDWLAEGRGLRVRAKSDPCMQTRLDQSSEMFDDIVGESTVAKATSPAVISHLKASVEADGHNTDTDTNPDTDPSHRLPCYGFVADQKFDFDTACSSEVGEGVLDETSESSHERSQTSQPSPVCTTPLIRQLMFEMERLVQENNLLKQNCMESMAGSAASDCFTMLVPVAIAVHVANMALPCMMRSPMDVGSHSAAHTNVAMQNSMMPNTGLIGPAEQADDGPAKDLPSELKGRSSRRRRHALHVGQTPAQANTKVEDDIIFFTSSTSSACDEMRTTVMLRNLPNNYARAMVLNMLDEEGFKGEFNFFYLPIDFKSCACLGYAFVNLVDPSVVPRFWRTFSGYSRWALPSRKACGVSWSGPHQGLEAHVERYRNSPVMHPSVADECKPVIFQAGQRVPFPPPLKMPRAPRVRNHNDYKIHWSSAAGMEQAARPWGR